MKPGEMVSEPQSAGSLPVFPVVEIPALSAFASRLPAGERGHEMSDEGADASVRFLARLVPVAYAALLGATGGNWVAWLIGGIAASLAFDLSTGDDSMLRAGLRRLVPGRRGSPNVCRVDVTRH